jgi:hypothetical protein
MAPPLRGRSFIGEGLGVIDPLRKPADVRLLGVLLAAGVVLYAIPRTAFWGAIYLTAYLGGALAAHLRIGSPLATHVLFAVYVAGFVWVGLALRSPAFVRLLLRGTATG